MSEAERSRHHQPVRCSPGMTDLDQLAGAAQRGDRVALAGFVRATQADVWRFCAYLAGRDAADDLAQDSYVRALHALPAWRHDAPARVWLLAIVRRTVADHHRRNRRRRLLTPRAARRRRRRRFGGACRPRPDRRAGARPAGRVRSHPGARPALRRGGGDLRVPGGHDPVAGRPCRDDLVEAEDDAATA